MTFYSHSPAVHKYFVTAPRQIGSLLFIADQEFAESIEKRVRNLNDPVMCPEVWLAFQHLLLLTSGPDIWSITALYHRVSTTSMACVQAQVLRRLRICFWAQHYHMVQCFLQQFDVVGIRSRNNDCQRESLFIHQNTACFLVPPACGSCSAFWRKGGRTYLAKEQSEIKTKTCQMELLQAIIETFARFLVPEIL